VLICRYIQTCNTDVFDPEGSSACKCTYSVGTMCVQCGYSLGTLWVQFGYNVGTVWVQCGYIVGTIWVQCGYNLQLGQNINVNVNAAQNAVSGTPKVRDIEQPAVCMCPVLHTAHANQHTWMWSQKRGCRSAAARLLGLWVRIPLGAWICVCCECCVLSGRGLCDGLITCPEESYRMWCVSECYQV
jgi:hypothetical protein